jgi:RNAse (barnase) inhibitor barstar
MVSQHVRLESKRITDWDSFNSVFAETLGFPDFYGRNMDAWIDRMSSLDDAGAGMSRLTVLPGELFHLEVADAKDFQQRLPEIFEAFIDCTAFVNRRRTDEDKPPVYHWFCYKS